MCSLKWIFNCVYRVLTEKLFLILDVNCLKFAWTSTTDEWCNTSSYASSYMHHGYLYMTQNIPCHISMHPQSIHHWQEFLKKCFWLKNVCKKYMIYTYTHIQSQDKGLSCRLFIKNKKKPEQKPFWWKKAHGKKPKWKLAHFYNTK